jgi:hypothetical protein
MDPRSRIWCDAVEDMTMTAVDRLAPAEDINRDRRRFLGAAAWTMAAARLGMFSAAEARGGELGELSALGRAAAWINSPPLTSANLLGKVVVVNFCTYTCINWLRTLPAVRAWSRAYGRDLVVVGVHTPEFGFEHDLNNVRQAVERLDIDYPIAIDNDYAIWRAFKNHYWPALYFIDARGRVRQQQFGEGDYERWEMFVQRLLAEAGAGGMRPGVGAVEGHGIEVAADWGNLKSPETYVGYDRAENFASRGGASADRRRLYTAPDRLALNQWALAGEWTIGKEATVLNAAGGRIAFRFHARDLHLVMGPSRQGTPIRFRVTLDRQPAGPAHGIDVDSGGNGTVLEPRLYQLVRQSKPVEDRLFEIEFLDAGVETFAFTFG